LRRVYAQRGIERLRLCDGLDGTCVVLGYLGLHLAFQHLVSLLPPHELLCNRLASIFQLRHLSRQEPDLRV
jgi:hypothetical protein